MTYEELRNKLYNLVEETEEQNNEINSIQSDIDDYASDIESKADDIRSYASDISNYQEQIDYNLGVMRELLEDEIEERDNTIAEMQVEQESLKKKTEKLEAALRQARLAIEDALAILLRDKAEQETADEE